LADVNVAFSQPYHQERVKRHTLQVPGVKRVVEDGAGPGKRSFERRLRW
jgi:hypothetical protein